MLSFTRASETRPPLTNSNSNIDLNPDELGYYPFVVSLDRCDGSCNTVDGPSTMIFGQSDRLCVPKKTTNIDVFNVQYST